MLSNEKHVERYAYKVKDAAAAIGLGLTTTWGLVNSGVLKSVRVGRRVLVTTEAIREFLALAGAGGVR
jgi:excisionase family DNA binding protein